MAAFINGVTNYNEWRDHSKDNRRYLERMALIDAGMHGLSDAMRLVQAVVVSEMTGKLEGMWALSTSVLMNPICQCRAKDPECICHDCYACNTASRYSATTQALETNHLILNNFLIPEVAWATLTWPTTNGDARIEWAGDVASITCARNYLRIIKTHPWLNFGVWTKNVNIWMHAFELEGGKPQNMKFIVSSPYVNRPVEISEELLPRVDHRFTVYTKEFASANGIVINCGGRKCITCRNCYGDDPFDICEILK